MTLQDTPQARSADRARRAAERARLSRERAAQAARTDAVIVDALAQAMIGLRRGTSVEAFVRKVAGDAISRLQTAGIEKPRTAFRQRMGLIARSRNGSLS